MIYMICHVTLTPGKRDEYVREFKLIADAVFVQKGCIEYNIFVDSTDPRFNNVARQNMVMISEKWESIEDLQEHSKSQIMNDFRLKIKDLRVASDYEILTGI